MNESTIESFYKEYFQYLPHEFDGAYILHANSGEIYCFLAYLAKAHIKKNNIQKPLFVATKPYHKDIIKLFFPKEPYIYYDMYQKEPRLNTFEDSFEYGNYRFYQIFSTRHFDEVNSNVGKIHYFDAMLNTLDIKRDEVSLSLPKLGAKTKKDVIKIAEKIGLNIDNFVILAPEAPLTINPMPSTFWNSLVRELDWNDYDIFVNAIKPTEIKGKTCNLSLSELFALCTYAKAVISLRSGVSEFLIPTKTKNITLCPRFHWSAALSAQRCIDAYSLMKLPFIDKKQVYEINTELYPNEKELIKMVTEII